MFTTRSLVNSIQIFLKLLEAQEVQKSFHPDGFDLGALPLKSPNYKASPHERDPVDIKHLTVHVVAVKNGIGTSPRQRKKWGKRMVGGALWLPLGLVGIARELESAGVLAQRHLADVPVFSPERGYAFDMLDDPKRIAKRLATWVRVRNMPYHALALRNLDAVYNRRLEQRSYHGNGGNEGVGLGLDMHPSEDPGTEFALTGQRALGMLADRLAHAREREDRLPIVVRVNSHRQHQHPGRAGDPGKWATENVVLPVIAKRDDLVLDHGYTTGSGKPWPNRWDSDSPYDMRGRRIDGR